MEIDIIRKVQTDRPDLARKIRQAAVMARRISGLSLKDFAVKSSGNYSALLGGVGIADIHQAVEDGELVPSAIGLLVMAETAGVPVALLLGEPDQAEIILSLASRLRRLESFNAVAI